VDFSPRRATNRSLPCDLLNETLKTEYFLLTRAGFFYLASTDCGMTILTHSHCRFLIEKSDLHISTFIMTQMTTHTGCCILVNRLPAREKYMEMIVEILPLRDRRVTL